MNLQDFRLIVVNNMPYDTGFMAMAGANFYDTEHYMLCKYDTERVPYIIYNEEGTIFTTKNQYFIRRKTVGELISTTAELDSGTRSAYSNEAKRRAKDNTVSQGLLDTYGR